MGEFDPKGGDAVAVGWACGPYKDRKQSDSPKTGARGGSPLPPEAYAILLHADEMPDGGFEPPDADEGVEAGAVGPLVDDAEDGHAVAGGGEVFGAAVVADEVGVHHVVDAGDGEAECHGHAEGEEPPVAMATCTP